MYGLRRTAILAALVLPLSLVAGPAGAQAHEPPTAPLHGEHGAAHEGGAHGEHGAAHEGGAHAEEHQEFNWSYGFLGEKEGVQPDLLYRPKGMPAPFLANVINAAVLFGIIIAFGRKPIAEGLKKRKERIVAGMEEAGKMKAEAAERLAHYEEKIRHIDEEIERIKKGMRETAEAERNRILAEAKERRERMERDARLLIEQELKAAREMLLRETVAASLRSAEEILTKQLGAADHERMAKEYLELVQKAPIQSAGGPS